MVYQTDTLRPSKTKSRFTEATIRPRNKTNTINTLTNDFGYDRQYAKDNYSRELLDSLANTSPDYILGEDSSGNPVLNTRIIDKRKATEWFKNGGNIGTSSYENFMPQMGHNQTEGNQLDPGKNPILRKYNGQSHQGPEEGVEVDQQGNPSSLTGKAPVALTEKGEVNYNGYIFSDSIKYKK